MKALTVLTALSLSAFFVANTLLAAVTVTPATGGTNISIDTSSAGPTPAWTPLNSPTITESQVGQISAGTHTLTLPAGWEFETQNVSISVNGSNISLNSGNVTPSASSLDFIVNSVSTNIPAVLNFSGIKVRPTGTVVGTGNITHSGAFIADVTDGIGGTNFGTLTTVAGAVKQLGFTIQPTDITYGSNVSNVEVKTKDQFGNNSTVGLAANSNVTISLWSGSGALTGTTMQDIGTSAGNGTINYNNLYIDNVGAKVLRATGTGLTINTVDSNSFNINQKALTATITASDKVYDGNTSATIMTRTPVGVVGGDAVTVNGGTATFDNKNVGTGKTVTATGMTLGDVDASKYSFNGVGIGNADISQLAITVTADAGQAKVYGNADPVFTYTLSTPLVGGDLPTGALARANGNNVGMYAINSGTLSLGSNYNTNFVGANFTITARPLTISSAVNVKVYDKTTSAATPPAITSGSLAYSDTPNFVQVYGGPNVGNTKNLIPSGNVNDGNGGNNYTYTFVTNPIGVVTPKGLDVTGLTANSKVYNQSTAATISGVASLSGVIAGDTVNLSGVAVGNHNTANVGATTVTVTGLSVSNSNYFLNPIILNSSITAYPVTVTVNAGQSKVYGTTDPAFTYSSTGLLVGDNFTGSMTRDAGEPVGNYNVLQGTLTAGNNYSITFVNLNQFAITPKAITVTPIAGQSKIYNTADPVFTYNHTPLVGADQFIVNTIGRMPGETVGAYNYTLGSLNAGANYTLSLGGSEVFTINKATPEITWNNPANIVYGTPLLGGQLNATANVPGVFTYNPIAGTILNAGTHSLSTDFVPTDTVNYNNVMGTSVSITVDKADPIITWADPAAIAAGTPLSSTQLGATANVAGSFTYNPTFGAFFTVVGNHALDVNFVPTDTTNYNNASKTVHIDIYPAPIHHLDIDATPTSQTVGLPVAVSVKGYDQYNNLVTNDSATRVWVHAGGQANLNSASKVLVSGVAGFTLNSLVAGDSLVDTFSGSLIPDEITVTFVGDTTAPTITPDGTPVQSITQNSAAIVFQSNENGQAKIHYGLTDSYGNVTNYQPVTANTNKSITITGLACGTTYHYAIYAKDLAGNEAIASDASFMTSACVSPIIPTVVLNGAAIQAQYTESQADARFSSGVQFDLTNTASVTVNGTPVANAATITAASNAEAKAIGVHSYDVIVLSSTGHSASRNISFVVVANPDTTAPSLNVSAPVTAPTSASITFQSSEAGTARVSYGADNTYGTITPEYSVLAATNRTITLTGLACETTYHFSVSVNDLANNTTNSTDATFMTGACPTGDAIAPSVTVSSPDVTDTTATIHFTTDEDGLAKVNYGLTAPAYGQVTEYSPMTTAGDNIIAITGLTCGTTYHYSVYGLDSSDNGQGSADMTFTTTACPVAPVISHDDEDDIEVDQITADITFNSNQDGTAKIYYGLSDSYGNVTGDTAVTAGNDTTITLTGLFCGTTYHYGISAKNSNGDESLITDYSFTTADCGGDFDAPTVTAQTPTDNSTSQVIDITPTVTFSEIMDLATVNATTVQLRKYSDDSVISSVVTLDVNGLEATITPVNDLANGTQYYIYVSGAKDLAGNDVEAYTTKETQEFTTVTAPTGTFGIISAIMTKMTGIADNDYTHGWEWLIRMTLPTDQNNFALKFSDWISGSNTLTAGGNMQYYSEQISSGLGSSATPVNITTTDVYPANVQVTDDADASTDGIQTDVHVRVKLPATTESGSYSSSYRVNYSN